MALRIKKKNTTVKKIVKRTPTAPVAPRHQVGAAAQPQQFTIPSSEYVDTVGRRKVATARVRLYTKPGDFVVNDQLVSQYFGGIIHSPSMYNRPFDVTGTKGKYAVTVKVTGSGISSQLDAVVHAISRALVKMNPDLKPLLKEAGLMTRDSRMKETRKIGTGGKARRKRQSPKR